MNLLHMLENAIGLHHGGGSPQQSHDPIRYTPGTLGNNIAQAARYAKDPMNREFIGVDPSQFGYPPDNSGSQLQVNSSNGSSQGGMYNPGFTPLQNVNPPQLNQNPQFQGYNATQGIQGNQGFYWDNGRG